VKVVNGIPEGWKRVTLADICFSISYGYTASAISEDTGLKFVRITDIVPSVIDWSKVPYCNITENKKEQYLLKEGDLIVARTGATVGYAKRIHKRHPEVIFASYLVRMRLFDDVDNMMVGIFVESDEYKNYIKANVGGAAQPNANARIISGAKILVPSKEIQKLFREKVEPIFDQKEILQIQNQKLKETRDLLLPRLMNGSIAV
jgi:type I restriction enzyme S subunit